MTTPHPAELPRESELADEELVALVLAGQTAQFAVLMRRYNQRLFRAARAITRDEDEAEDVVQQAFLSAYQKLDSFEGRARFSTWLTRIAVNEALARLRRRRRLSDVELRDLGDSARIPAAEEPEQAASRRELGQILERAIDSLPESYRTVYMLREVEEMRTAETAEALGLSEEAVRVRLHRARTALREELLERAGVAASDIFGFAGPRCDRIVAAVFSKLHPLPPTAPPFQ